MGNQNEIWKDVEGYEELYQVNNKRRVKSLDYRHTGKERALKQYKDKDGYLFVILCKDGEKKCCRIHRLVARAFIPNPKGYPEVNHKDENPSNNYAENLEWCTREYNINYGTRNERDGKSKGKPVLCIETNIIYFSTHEAQRKTGIDASNICKCARRNGRYHTARRYHWEFV